MRDSVIQNPDYIKRIKGQPKSRPVGRRTSEHETSGNGKTLKIPTMFISKHSPPSNTNKKQTNHMSPN